MLEYRHMIIRAIKTHKIISGKQSIIQVIDAAISGLNERSIVAITSKIVALCEGSVVPVGSISKTTLINKEADYYLPTTESQYGITLTIKNNILIPSAGIDESNSKDGYVLWPKDAQKPANGLRLHLANRFKLKDIGVIITDSKTTPLRWGTTGVAIAHSGFKALNDYIGKPDIFGKPMRVTKANIMDGLAAAAVLVMGEGSEQTPLAVIEDIDFIQFTGNDPTEDELADLKISIEDDLYAPILKKVDWLHGKH